MGVEQLLLRPLAFAGEVAVLEFRFCLSARSFSSYSSSNGGEICQHQTHQKLGIEIEKRAIFNECVRFPGSS